MELQHFQVQINLIVGIILFLVADIGFCKHSTSSVLYENGWRVELSHNFRGGDAGGGGGRGGGRGHSGGCDLKCYECGKLGHFACECRSRSGTGRCRSRSPPRYRRSPSYGRRSYSPCGQSPRRRSVSSRGRSYSRSPVPYRAREEVPYANRNGFKNRC